VRQAISLPIPFLEFIMPAVTKGVGAIGNAMIHVSLCLSLPCP